MKIGFFGLLTLLVIVEKCRGAPSTSLVLEQILETVKKIELLMRETTKPSLCVAMPIALKRPKARDIDAIRDHSDHRPRVPSAPKPPATNANDGEDPKLTATNITGVRDAGKPYRKRQKANGNSNANLNTNEIGKKLVKMAMPRKRLTPISPEILKSPGIEGVPGNLGKDSADGNVNANVNTNVNTNNRILTFDDED